MSLKKNRKDNEQKRLSPKEILAKKKVLDYESVRADYDDWWFRCFIDMAEEGKITREEVNEIATNLKKDRRIG